MEWYNKLHPCHAYVHPHACIVKSSPSKYSFYWSDHFLWKVERGLAPYMLTFSQVFSYKAETYFVDRSSHPGFRSWIIHENAASLQCTEEPFLWTGSDLLCLWVHAISLMTRHTLEPCLTCPWFKIVQLLLLMMVCHSLLLSSSESVPTVCAVLDEHNSKLEGGVSTLQHTLGKDDTQLSLYSQPSLNCDLESQSNFWLEKHYFGVLLICIVVDLSWGIFATCHAVEKLLLCISVSPYYAKLASPATN